MAAESARRPEGGGVVAALPVMWSESRVGSANHRRHPGRFTRRGGARRLWGGGATTHMLTRLMEADAHTQLQTPLEKTPTPHQRFKAEILDLETVD